MQSWLEKSFLNYIRIIICSLRAIAEIGQCPDMLCQWDGIGIEISNLADLPPFCRFDEVTLWYSAIPGILTIAEKCKLFGVQLQTIKPECKNAKLTRIRATITQGSPFHFNDRSEFVDYFANEFLPIWKSSRGYKFELYFGADENAAASAIESVLLMGQIKRCREIIFTIDLNYAAPVLRIRSILKWLFAEHSDGVEKGHERVLTIKINVVSVSDEAIQNERRICKQIKKVDN